MPNIIEITGEGKIIEVFTGGFVLAGAGAADLTYTASPTNGVITNSNGAGFTIPAGSTTNASLIIPADKTKLNAIEAGATANSPDAYLLSRTNHIGSQAISTITGLQTTLDAKLEASSIASFETTTQLNARDVSNRNRNNHTGTQSVGTITGLATVATTGDYGDLSGKPTLLSQFANDVNYFAPLALTNNGTTNATLINSALASAVTGQIVRFPDGTFPVNAPLLDTQGTQWVTSSRYSTRLQFSEASMANGQSLVTSTAQNFNLGGVAIEWLGGADHPTKVVNGLYWSRPLYNPDSTPALDSVGRITVTQPEIRGVSGYAIIVEQAINMYIWNARYISCRNGFLARPNQLTKSDGLPIISTTVFHFGGYFENLRERALVFDNCSEIILDGNCVFENCGYYSTRVVASVADASVNTAEQLPQGSIVAYSSNVKVVSPYFEANRMNFSMFDSRFIKDFTSEYNKASVPCQFANKFSFPAVGNDSLNYLALDDWTTHYWGFGLDENKNRTGSPKYIQNGTIWGTYSRAGSTITGVFTNKHGLTNATSYPINFPTGGATAGNFVVTVVDDFTITLNNIASGTIALGSIEVVRPSRSVYPTASDLFTQISGTFTRTGTLCSVNSTAHGLTNGQIYGVDFDNPYIAKADDYVITVVDANNFTFNTVASGTIASNGLKVTKTLLAGAIDGRTYTALDTSIAYLYNDGTKRFTQKFVPDYVKYFGLANKDRGRLERTYNRLIALGWGYEASKQFTNRSELTVNRTGDFVIEKLNPKKGSHGSSNRLAADVASGYVSPEGAGLVLRSTWGFFGNTQIGALNCGFAQENFAVTAGTLSSSTPAQSMRRHVINVGNSSTVASNVLTSATAGTNVTTADLVASLRANLARFHRGTATSQQASGFAYQSLFASAVNTDATRRIFVGLCSSITSFGSNSLATIADMLGVFKDTADTTWQIVRRTGSGTLQKVDTGIVIADNQLLELKILCNGYDVANGSPVTMELYVHYADGTTDLFKGTYSDNLPESSTFLAERFAVQNGSGNVSSSLSHIHTSIGHLVKNDSRFSY
jgi:hypothetical protein